LSKVEASSNVVLVGRKPVMNYVVACLTYFNQRVNTVTLRARGSAISKAVDTVELLRRAFVSDLLIDGISTGTEIVEWNERRSNISTIEIVVRKPEALQ
jgi:DNA-binding protein